MFSEKYFVMLTLSGTSTLSLDNNTQMLLGCGVLFAPSSRFLRSKLTLFGPDWFGLAKIGSDGARLEQIRPD